MVVRRCRDVVAELQEKMEQRLHEQDEMINSLRDALIHSAFRIETLEVWGERVSCCFLLFFLINSVLRLLRSSSRSDADSLQLCHCIFNACVRNSVVVSKCWNANWEPT